MTRLHIILISVAAVLLLLWHFAGGSNYLMTSSVQVGPTGTEVVTVPDTAAGEIVTVAEAAEKNTEAGEAKTCVGVKGKAAWQPILNVIRAANTKGDWETFQQLGYEVVFGKYCPHERYEQAITPFYYVLARMPLNMLRGYLEQGHRLTDKELLMAFWDLEKARYLVRQGYVLRSEDEYFEASRRLITRHGAEAVQFMVENSFSFKNLLTDDGKERSLFHTVLFSIDNDDEPDMDLLNRVYQYGARPVCSRIEKYYAEGWRFTLADQDQEKAVSFWKSTRYYQECAESGR
ncbi:MAG: hypothetical protein KYX62_05050 [Pseudomonadota bacterium]|nr:hypothetical protein [Pseudomonadota bacterium]